MGKLFLETIDDNTKGLVIKCNSCGTCIGCLQDVELSKMYYVTENKLINVLYDKFNNQNSVECIKCGYVLGTFTKQPPIASALQRDLCSLIMPKNEHITRILTNTASDMMEYVSV